MRVLGTLLLIVVLSACSGASDPPVGAEPADETASTAEAEAEPPVVETLPTGATRAWSVKLRAFSNPVAAGNTLVVVVTAREDELDIVGLDRATGKQRWRSPFLTTGNRDGVWLGDLVHESADGEQFVVFQRPPDGAAPTPGAAAPYVALDPATGEEVARTRPVRTSYGPVRCDDDHDICLRLDTARGGDTRWVLGEWRLVPEGADLPDDAGWVDQSVGLYVEAREVGGITSTIAVGRTDGTPWRVTARSLGAKGGWRLYDGDALVDEEAGVAVMQLQRPATEVEERRFDSGRTVVLEQSRRRTIGIDLETGRRVWRHDGADFTCLEMTRSEIPVRCGYDGGVASRSSWKEPRLRGTTGSVEGYDVSTGRTTWAHRVSRRAVEVLLLGERVLDPQLDVFADGEDLIVVPTRDGDALVSLLDGSSRKLRRSETLLCTVKVLTPYALDVRNTYDYPGTEQRVRHTRRPCDTRGQDSDARLGTTALLTGAEDVGEGMWAFAGFDTVEAWRVS